MNAKQEERLVAALELLAKGVDSLAKTSQKRFNKEHPQLRKKDAQVFNISEEPEGETFKGRYERRFEEATETKRSVS
jgi:hypothetical protein